MPLDANLGDGTALLVQAVNLALMPAFASCYCEGGG
jgi:hypothetical protein